MSNRLHSERWRKAMALDALRARGKSVVKLDGKQIALFAMGEDVYACNNRCPHEGYPLVEGTLSLPEEGADEPRSCLLTCNWHNWKFDLADGRNVLDGDALRVYPAEIRDGAVWVDIADPPAEALIDGALAGIVDAMPKHEYDRIAREIARLQKAGGDPLDAVRAAVRHMAERLEYGWTHAFAAAPDWLALADRAAETPAQRLAALTEIVGHMAWDTMREHPHPYPAGRAPYDEDAFVAAIDAEDESAAIAYLNGALDAGLGFAAVERGLARAALAHYQGFGHALIYVEKAGELIDRLGPDAAAPLLRALVRYLVYTEREDLIPEFKAYHPTLEAWRRGSRSMRVKVPSAEEFVRLPVTKAMKAALAGADRPEALFEALLTAAATQFLTFRREMDFAVDNPVSQNTTWLDFTHAITFANAVRRACGKYPELWGPGLLQIACFTGRNAGFLDPDVRLEDWAVDDPAGFLDSALATLFDHDQPEYIVSCHYVKLLTAAREEILHRPGAEFGPVLAAAINRMIALPIRRKHALRTATQSLDFVAREG